PGPCSHTVLEITVDQKPGSALAGRSAAERTCATFYRSTFLLLGPSKILRPHLSIRHRHLGQVQPPDIACSNDDGIRIIGISAPQLGHDTRWRLIPHLSLRAVPRIGNSNHQRAAATPSRTTFVAACMWHTPSAAPR